MKRVTKNKGFTLVEMMLSCAIIAVFFLGSSAVLGSSAKAYIQETRSSGARGAIETAADDIKNYVMSGKDIKLMFYMDGVRDKITASDGTVINVRPSGGVLEEGTILYTDGSFRKADGTLVTGDAALQLAPADTLKLAEVAEGIDLGYKIIYISNDRKSIQGLPYARDYYRGMTMTLKISCKEDDPIDAFHVNGNSANVERKKKQKLYTISLTGNGKEDIYMITSSTAVVSMNDSEFN